MFADYLQIHFVRQSGELAVLCGAIIGAGIFVTTGAIAKEVAGPALLDDPAQLEERQPAQVLVADERVE